MVAVFFRPRRSRGRKNKWPFAGDFAQIFRFRARDFLGFDFFWEFEPKKGKKRKKLSFFEIIFNFQSVYKVFSVMFETFCPKRERKEEKRDKRRKEKKRKKKKVFGGSFYEKNGYTASRRARSARVVRAAGEKKSAHSPLNDVRRPWI